LYTEHADDTEFPSKKGKRLRPFRESRVRKPPILVLEKTMVDLTRYIDNGYQYYYNFALALMVFKRKNLVSSPEADQEEMLIY
jgi:hypothetical protein